MPTHHERKTLLEDIFHTCQHSCGSVSNINNSHTMLDLSMGMGKMFYFWEVTSFTFTLSFICPQRINIYKNIGVNKNKNR